MSTDRDNKVRVSILPPHGHRMGGAHEVQAFCLGHNNFVTSAAAVLGDSGTPEVRPAFFRDNAQFFTLVRIVQRDARLRPRPVCVLLWRRRSCPAQATARSASGIRTPGPSWRR